MSQTIRINTAEIPQEFSDKLAAGALGLLRQILAQPGGREALDQRIAARKAAKNTEIPKQV